MVKVFSFFLCNQTDFSLGKNEQKKRVKKNRKCGHSYGDGLECFTYTPLYSNSFHGEWGVGSGEWVGWGYQKYGIMNNLFEFIYNSLD